jgi:hypothetical protein
MVGIPGADRPFLGKRRGKMMDLGMAIPRKVLFPLRELTVFSRER